MSFLLFSFRLRFCLNQGTRDLHIRAPVIFKKGGESSYGAKIPLQADNAGFPLPNLKGVTADRPCFLLEITIFSA